MPNLNSCKGKHLTKENRVFIEYALDEQYTLKEIAERLGKDPTTISKEIKRNRVFSSHKRQSDLYHCQNHKNCNKKLLCKESCGKLCKKCTKINCYRICPEYSSTRCLKLTRFPYVCNGCNPTTVCHSERYQYKANVAEATYKYFDKNVFTTKSIDLPRKVKLKPRKKTTASSDSNASHRIGRTYDDFNLFLAENPDTAVVEMDTVYGTRSGKVLLTFFFRKSSLMLAFISAPSISLTLEKQ